MNRLGLVAALTGFTVVSLGAFGAHALSDAMTPKQQDWWETATLYALVHAVAALAVSLAAQSKALKVSGSAFLLGVWIFSGSLYAMGLGAPTWLGAITPIGGICLLIGWVSCAVAAAKV